MKKPSTPRVTPPVPDIALDARSGVARQQAVAIDELRLANQALQQMLNESHQQLHATKIENLTLRRELARRMEQATPP